MAPTLRRPLCTWADGRSANQHLLCNMGYVRGDIKENCGQTREKSGRHLRGGPKPLVSEELSKVGGVTPSQVPKGGKHLKRSVWLSDGRN